jgi:hypothetical protein
MVKVKNKPEVRKGSISQWHKSGISRESRKKEFKTKPTGGISKMKSYSSTTITIVTSRDTEICIYYYCYYHLLQVFWFVCSVSSCIASFSFASDVSPIKNVEPYETAANNAADEEKNNEQEYTAELIKNYTLKTLNDTEEIWYYDGKLGIFLVAVNVKTPL